MGPWNLVQLLCRTVKRPNEIVRSGQINWQQPRRLELLHSQSLQAIYSDVRRAHLTKRHSATSVHSRDPPLVVPPFGTCTVTIAQVLSAPLIHSLLGSI